MASGMALVAVVGWGLIQSSNDARDRAIWAARSDARDLALAMRAALRRPAILELCDAADRFEVHDGDVVLDASIGWLIASHPAPIDSLWRLKLNEAEQAEFVAHNLKQAEVHFDELLERIDDTDPQALVVLAKAAWFAHRNDDMVRATALAARMQTHLATAPIAALGDRQLAGVLAAHTLLTVALQQELDHARLNQLAALPERLATATLRRLQEFGVATEQTAATLRTVVRRRETLRHATTLVRRSAQSGAVQASNGHVVLWFPGVAPGTGQGAIVAAEWLQQLPGLGTTREANDNLPPIPDRGRVVFAASEHAEPILDTVAWAEPPPLPEVPWFTQPIAVLTAGLGLLLLFAGSVWATMRGLARETAAMRTRTEFLSGVTHELKTPVAGLRLMADVLNEDDVEPKRQREYFAMMAGEAARLSALIDNVLDLGQMERGERSYDMRTEDAADVVRDAVRSYTPIGNHAGLSISLREGTASATATLDRGAITQALLNLMENARKYASKGKRIDITTDNGDANFTVCVRDHGPGIASDEREQVFARFQRGKAQVSGSVSGVGLGLFLSRAILERHGGTLTCHAPEDGSGSVFQLTLPLTHTTPSNQPPPQ